MPRSLRALFPALAAVLLAAPPALAQDGNRLPIYDTLLLSKSVDGGLPNGPSSNAVMSQDGRFARAVAFQSDASDIVNGDTNGFTDVFVLQRPSTISDNGDPWEPAGPARLVSRGMNGQQANGPSYNPAIDGDTSRGDTAPSCVAFVSRASNLVPRDTNGKADAFVFYLKTGVIKRVSVSSNGRQSNGDTFDVALDGNCEKVAFTSDATNLAQTTVPRTKPNYVTVKTARNKPGVKQVYMRVLSAARSSDKALVGLTFLASASNKGRPGNADSYDPSISLRTDELLVFTSNATNLDRRDRTPAPDVYANGIARIIGFFPDPRRPRRRLKAATLQRRIRVASVNRNQTAGNGPSTEGAASDQACFVIFQTQATDIISGDNNPTSDIVRADVRGFMIASKVFEKDSQGCREIDGAAAERGDVIDFETVARGNGPSTQPETAGGGEYNTFTSEATNFPLTTALQGDRNDVSDMFLWTGVRNVIRMHSADTDNDQLSLPSYNSFPSQRINYILFETRDPFADKVLLQRRYPQLYRDKRGTLARAQQNPAFNQIYLRYLGGREF